MLPYRIITLLVCAGILCVTGSRGADLLGANTNLVLATPAPEVGAHYRVWKVAPSDPLVSTNESSYVEIASGLHYEDENGELQRTEELIESVATGAVARRGPHKVIFAANINSAGAVDMETQEKHRLVSTVLGLSYLDVASGKSVLIAEIKDSVGELLPSGNEIVYPDAFTEGIKADVRYTYTKAGLEQDIILRENPPGPTEYGLDPATTRLQVLTEFHNPPEPTKTERSFSVARAQSVETNFTDETLSFGDTQIGVGRAFSLGSTNSNLLQVGKSWEKLEGRDFLVESVDFLASKPDLDALPPASAQAVATARTKRTQVAASRVLPTRRLAKALPGAMRMAAVGPNKAGFVIDYATVSTISGMTFQSDNTYFVSDPVVLSSTTTFEGGAVIKYNGTTSKITITGPIVCETSEYRPVIFTSKHDDNYGEMIDQSSGNPTTGSYGTALELNSSGWELKHFRFYFANKGVSTPTYGTVSHSQFRSCYIGCQPAPGTYTLTAQNLLFANCGWAFNGSSIVVNAYHITMDGGTFVAGGSSVNAYNSLIFGTGGYMNSQDTTILASSSGVFQTVAGGQRYLAASSSYRNAANISWNSTSLTKELRTKTTYPPQTLQSAISTPTILTPVVSRDVDTLDRGYHYDPIDYVVDDSTVTSSLLITNGVVLAVKGGTGLRVQGGGSVISEGGPLTMNQFARCETVQEVPTFAPAMGMATIRENYSTGTRPNFYFRFSRFSLPHATGNHLTESGNAASLVFQDCTFGSGGIYVGTVSTVTRSIALTNCLFERAVTTLGSGTGNGLLVHMRNSAAIGGSLSINPATANTWTFHNNYFGNGLAFTQPTAVVNSHNGYFSTSGGARLTPNAASDQVLASSPFVAGPLGKYYQAPAGPLINLGNAKADAVGLFHYTTQVSQNKEKDTDVDIGYHYVSQESWYSASGGFKNIQGANQWSYKYGSALGLPTANFPTYDSGGGIWEGAPGDPGCRIAATWHQTGVNYDSIRTFTAPHTGTIDIQSTAIDLAFSWAGNGVQIRVLKNSSAVFDWTTLPEAQVLAVNATVQVTQGDQIHFQVSAISGNNTSDWIQWDPTVTYARYDSDSDASPDYLEDRNGDGVSSSVLSGLVAHWRFDETTGTIASDSSGLGNGGTLYATPASVGGIAGNAFSFNGANYVQVANSTSMRVGNGGADFTVSLWFKLQQNADGQWRCLFHKGGVDSERTFAMWLDLSANRVLAIISSDQAPNQALYTSIIPLNTWTHITYLKRGNKLRLYLNGAFDSELTLTGTVVANNGPLYIGKDPWYSGVVGSMDEFRVYSRSLSDTEIRGLAVTTPEPDLTSSDTDYDGVSDAQELADGSNPTDPSSVLQKRLGYWKFNTTDLKGEQGQLPTYSLGTLADGFSGKVLQANENGQRVIYRESEATNQININARQGTLRFWFKPSWASGSGPQTYGRLVELGTWTSDGSHGWWALQTDPLGSGLYLQGHNQGNITGAYFPLNLQAQKWHQLVICYSQTETKFYLNGQFVSGSGPVTSWAPAQIRAAGFSIGDERGGYQSTKGHYDEFETFNYPLSASEIADNYKAVMNSDVDYDGRGDIQETYDGTSPSINLSVKNVLLGFWDFDAASYAGEAGQLPTLTRNVTQIASWTNSALVISGAMASNIKYAEIDPINHPNFNLQRGTIAFWFRPAWDSGSGGAPTSARLFDVGTTSGGSTVGYWGLQLRNQGSTLAFRTEADGTGLDHIVINNLGWKANEWHRIVVAYSASHSAIYIDGKRTSGAGTIRVPSQAVRSTGFSFGGKEDGTDQSVGRFEHLATYNYPWSDGEALLENEAARARDTDMDGANNILEEEKDTEVGDSDTDNDGMPDGWEIAHGLNPKSSDADLDPDFDGFLNLTEYNNRTDPNVKNDAIAIRPPYVSAGLQSSLINVDFTSSQPSPARSGTAVFGYNQYDTWNHFNAVAQGGFAEQAIFGAGGVEAGTIAIIKQNPLLGPIRAVLQLPTVDEAYLFGQAMSAGYSPAYGALRGNGTIDSENAMYGDYQSNEEGSPIIPETWWEWIQVEVELKLNQPGSYLVCVYGHGNTADKAMETPFGSTSGRAGWGTSAWKRGTQYTIGLVNTAPDGRISLKFPGKVYLNGLQLLRLQESGPGAPTNVRARPGFGQVTLYWDHVPEAQFYMVRRAASASGPFITIGETENPVFTDTGLQNGQTYYYAVVAGIRVPTIPDIICRGPDCESRLVWTSFLSPNSQVISGVPVGVNLGKNVAPSLSKVDVLEGALQDTAFKIPYSVLLQNSDASDANKDAILFEKSSVIGTVTGGGVDGILAPGEEWIWTPPAGYKGRVEAFLVQASDGKLRSAAPVIVQINVKKTAVLVSWGANGSGQLGIGFRGDSSTPRQVGRVTKPVQISASGVSSYAVTPDGRVWTWGWGRVGQLAEGPIGGPFYCWGLENRFQPDAIADLALSDVASVNSSSLHALALKKDGTVWSWGWGDYGQLGDKDNSGADVCRNWPVKVTGLPSITEVATTFGSSAALDVGGNVWIWGDGYGYIQGVGERPTAFSIPGAAQVKHIAGAGRDFVALDSTGKLFDWGSDHPIPAQVVIPPGRSATAIAAGDTHLVALLDDGSIVGWGDNNFGQLGNGTFTAATRQAPAKAKNILRATRVFAGGNRTYAELEDGSIWGWGENEGGYLGDGSTGYKAGQTTPVVISDLHSVGQLSVGGWHGLAVASLNSETPTELRVKPGDQRAFASWKAYPGAVSYTLKRSDRRTGGFVSVGTVKELSFVDLGLKNFQTYYYVVSAFTSAGETANSYVSEVMPRPAPAPPEPTATTTKGRRIELSWPSVNTVSSYTIKRATTSAGPYTTLKELPHGSQSFWDRNLDPNTTFFYILVANNEIGSTSSAAVSGTTTDAGPSQPTPAPTAVVQTDERVLVSWTQVSGATEYIVRVSNLPGGPFTTLAEGLGGLSLLVERPDEKVKYYYAIVAANAAGDSPRSPNSTVVAPPLPTQAPANLTAAAGSDFVYLQWDNMDAAGYVVDEVNSSGNMIGTPGPAVEVNSFIHTPRSPGTYYYKVRAYNEAGDGPISASVSVEVTGASSPEAITFVATPLHQAVRTEWGILGQEVVSVRLYRKSASQPSFELVAESTRPDVLGRTDLDEGLVNGQAYTYMLALIDNSGFSKFAGPRTVTPQPAPSSPTGLQATSGNTEIQLTWTASASGNPTDYEIMSSSEGQGFKSVGVISGTRFVHRFLKNDIPYSYYVLARNPYGNSLPSTSVSAQPAKENPPFAPTTLIAIPGKLRVSLRWDASSAATGYRIWRKATGGSFGAIAIVTTTNFTDTGLATTPYEYTVQPLPTVGNTAPSAPIATVTPLSGDGAPPPSSGYGGTVVLVSPINETSVRTPTNLTLVAKVTPIETSLATAKVEFFADELFLGASYSEPHQFTWIDAPAGSHQLRARVLDTAGNSAVSAAIAVEVIWRADAGYFATSIQDVQLPAPGTPVGLARVYDSRTTSPSAGLFGRGWKTDFESIKLQVSSDLMSGWSGTRSAFGYAVAENTSHLVTISLPGGAVIQFAPRVRVSHQPLSGTRVGSELKLDFVPLPGTPGYLDILGNWLAIVPNSHFAWVGDITLKGGDPFGEFDGIEQEELGWSGFQYTTEDSRVFFFDEAGALKSISDKHGNTIEYHTPSTETDRLDIRYKYGASPGRTINAKLVGGRITEIYDPADPISNPSSKPVLKYVYNSDRLAAVFKLVDRTSGTYERTRYTYSATGTDLLADVFRSANFFTVTTSSASDPSDVLILHNEYEEEVVGSGKYRLDYQQDALGTRSVYNYDSPNRNVEVSLRNSTGTELSKVKQLFDASGRPSTAIDPANAMSHSAYDNRGRKVAETNALQKVTLYQYDSSDRLVSVVDPLGNAPQIEYNPDGSPSVSRDPLGNPTHFAYDSTGNLIVSVDAARLKTSYKYIATGLREEEKQEFDGTAFVTAYTYTALGDLYTSTDALNNVVTYTYDANGNRETETKVRTLTGTTTQRIIKTTYFYDAQNRIKKTRTEELDSGGTTVIGDPQETHVIFNALGRQEETIDAFNRSTKYHYDKRGNLTQTVAPAVDLPGGVFRSPVTRSIFDERNRMVYSTIRHDGGGTPENGSTATSPIGTRNYYDSSGRLTKTESLQDLAVVLTKDSASGTFEAAVASPAPSVISYSENEFDATGRTIWTRDARGTKTYYEYDDAGRRTKVWTFEDPAELIKIETVYSYDAAGNQTEVYDPLHQTGDPRKTTYRYDSSNRRIEIEYSVFVQGVAKKSSTIFDVFGRKTAEVDEADVVTGFGYDALGRLTSVTNNFKVGAGGSEIASYVTEYGYDQVGNLIRQTDANEMAKAVGVRKSTLFDYDGFGRRTKRILPLGETESGSFAKVPSSPGSSVYVSRKRVTDFSGRTLETLHDTHDRLKTKRYFALGANPDTATPNGIVSYTYEVDGQTDSVSEGGYTVDYQYHPNRRLMRKIAPEGALHYTYDAVGSVLTTKSQVESGGVFSDRVNGLKVTYTWDRLGRLATVIDDSIASGPKTTAYTYYKTGSLWHNTYPNGVKHEYEYTKQNRLTKLTVTDDGAARAEFNYGLGKSGNRISMVESGPVFGAGRGISYEYDNLYRLTKENITSDPNGFTGVINYAHDRTGNRTSRSAPSGSLASQLPAQTFTYNENDRITSPASAYDDNGNTLDEINTLAGIQATEDDEYDYENRIVQRKAIPNVGYSTTATIGYDPNGNRIRKTVTDVTPTSTTAITTYYLVDERNPSGYAQVVEELSYIGATPTPTAATLSRVYVYGSDLISQRAEPAATRHYYGYDGHGSVRLLTDPAGAVTDTYTYDAFGIPINQSGTTLNNYRYTGEQWDSDLGMYYLRARYMGPSRGRFWTTDSYQGDQGDPLSLHKYLYANGNAVNGIDPTGHFTSIEVGIASAIGASADAIYNGVVSGIGSAIQATLFGVQAGKGMSEILTEFLFDETGIGLAVDGYQALRGYFRDDDEAAMAAYTAWEEQMIATIIAAMEDNEFGEITLEIVPQCFVAGTPVATEGGLKPIEQIKVGDKVWSWNESTDQVTLRPVLNRFVHKRNEVFEIEAGRDVTKVTGEHPFFIDGKGWTPTRDIKAGDFFVTQDDESLVIDRIVRQQGEFLVYNFEVRTDHNYYVGKEAVLTHNANALRKAMRLNNPLLAAHHLVALRAQGAARARTLLAAAGIGLNDVRNGVALPRNLKITPPPGFSKATVHSIVHTDKYYRELTRRLSVVAPGQRVQVLRKAARELSIGKFPH